MASLPLGLFSARSPTTRQIVKIRMRLPASASTQCAKRIPIGCNHVKWLYIMHRVYIAPHSSERNRIVLIGRCTMRHRVRPLIKLVPGPAAGAAEQRGRVGHKSRQQAGAGAGTRARETYIYKSTKRIVRSNSSTPPATRGGYV